MSIEIKTENAGHTHNGIRASKQKGNWPLVTTRVSLKDEMLRETSQTYQQTLLHNNA